MKKIILLIFTFFSFFSYAQKQAYNWYFGDNAGFNFSTSPPTLLTNGQMIAFEGCATISDSSGALLFYTNGQNIWNKNHMLMDNGYGLKGHESSTQSAVIVPFPRNSKMFYVFTVDACHNKLANGMNYSIVDLSTNNGLGSVILKNKHLTDYTCEKIAAVQNRDTSVIWVITHEFDSNRFFSYRITPEKVDTIPVVSSVGSVHAGSNAFEDVCGQLGNARGYMKISPAGDKIVTCMARSNFCEVFDFDFITGKISNPLKINNFDQPYGTEFSPDGTKIYIASDKGTVATSDYVGFIYQIDLSSGKNDIIKQSVQLISSEKLTYGYGALQLAPDGRIYVVNAHSRLMDIIVSPNKTGTDCDFRTGQIILPSLRFARYGLPNFISTWFYKEDKTQFDLTDICLGDTVWLNHNISYAKKTSWYINDNLAYSTSSAKHVFDEAGEYEIKLICQKRIETDTVVRKIRVYKPPVFDLGNDTVLCAGSIVPLDTKQNSHKHLWSNGNTSPKIDVSLGGKYSVSVWQLDGCSATDSISVEFLETPILYLGNDTTLCIGDTFFVEPITDYASYKWHDGATKSSFRTTTSTSVSLTVGNQYGCYTTDSLNVNFVQNPVFSLGSDTAICRDSYLTLTPENNFASYSWSTSQSTKEIVVDQMGSYSLAVKDIYGCSAVDSIYVSILERPYFEIGNDTVICFGDSVTFAVENVEGSYFWNTGNTTHSQTITIQGLYKLNIIFDNGCSREDSVFVRVSNVDKWADSIPPICKNEYELPAQPSEYKTVTWFNEAGTQIDLPDTTGWFEYHVTNIYGCTLKESLFMAVYENPIIDTAYLSQADEITVRVHSNYDYSISLNPESTATGNVFSNLKNGVYTVLVVDTNGCTATPIILEILDYTLKIEIPNVFTPSGDAANNVLKLINLDSNIDKIADFEAYVYNRWGKQIHKSANPAIIWDGRNKFGYFAQGVYYLVIYITTKDGREYKYNTTVHLYSE